MVDRFAEILAVGLRDIREHPDRVPVRLRIKVESAARDLQPHQRVGVIPLHLGKRPTEESEMEAMRAAVARWQAELD